MQGVQSAWHGVHNQLSRGHSQLGMGCTISLAGVTVSLAQGVVSSAKGTVNLAWGAISSAQGVGRAGGRGLCVAYEPAWSSSRGASLSLCTACDPARPAGKHAGCKCVVAQKDMRDEQVRSVGAAWPARAPAWASLYSFLHAAYTPTRPAPCTAHGPA